MQSFVRYGTVATRRRQEISISLNFVLITNQRGYVRIAVVAEMVGRDEDFTRRCDTAKRGVQVTAVEYSVPSETSL